jgi:hypothetical protein
VVTKRFAGNNWKTVPQGLKPSPIAYSSAKAVPFVQSFSATCKARSQTKQKSFVDMGWLQDGNSCSIAIFYQLPPPIGTSKTNDRLQSYMVGCPLRENDFADRVTYGTGCGRRNLSGARSIQD